MTDWDDKLTAYEQAAGAATPGPWEEWHHGHLEERCICMSCDVCTGFTLKHQEDCEDRVPDQKTSDRCDMPLFSWEDAHFIVLARQAIPELIAKVRELTAEKEQLSTWQVYDRLQAQVAELTVEVEALRGERERLWSWKGHFISSDERRKKWQAYAAKLKAQLSEVKAACDDIVKYGAVDWTLSRYEEVTRGIDV